MAINSLWHHLDEDLAGGGGTIAEQKDARMKFLIEKVTSTCQLSGAQEVNMTPSQTRALAAALGKWNCRENINYGVFSPTSSPQKRPPTDSVGAADKGCSARNSSGGGNGDAVTKRPRKWTILDVLI